MARSHNAAAATLDRPKRRQATRSREQKLVPDELRRLLTAVAQRDPAVEAALGQLHDLTVGSLTALARAMLRDVQDAEEFVCDTYVQV